MADSSGGAKHLVEVVMKPSLVPLETNNAGIIRDSEIDCNNARESIRWNGSVVC